MRFFALETNVETLKKKFLVENEEAVHVTHKHFLVFLVEAFLPTVVAVAFLAIMAFGAAQDFITPEVSFWILLVGVIVYLYFLSSAHVSWRYNFLIITTQKIVLVEQRSMFYQRVNPVHFTNINNTRVESQFAGIFKCGILFINLKIGEQGGKHVELESPYVPNANDISSIIEHGIVMNEKKLKPEEEQKKKEAMQEPAIDGGNPEPDKLPEDQKQPEGIGLGAAIADVEPPPEKL